MRSIPRLAASSPRRRLLLGLGLGALAALGLTLLRGTDTLEALELQLIDLRTRHAAPDRAPDPRIVVMQIEEGDVEDVRRDLGQPWPWPLEVNAHIVRVLREADAAVLVVDILHLDRGAGPDDVPDSENLPPAARAQREGEARDAELYREALRDLGLAVLAFELAEHAPYEVPARRQAVLDRIVPKDLEAAPDALRRPAANLPVRRVTEGAALVGFTNAPPDVDGVVRRAPVLARWGERAVPSLALAGASLYGGGFELDERGVRAFTALQPLMPDQRFYVNHGTRPYARIAPAQVLAWALEREATGTLPQAAHDALQGRIVVWGIDLAGLKDVIPGPLPGVLDGPVWQATVIDNLLHGDGRVRAPRSVDRLLLFGLAMLAGVLGVLLRGRWLPHLVPLVLGGALVLTAFTVFRSGIILDLVTPLLALLLLWGGTFALRALTEGRRNKWLEGAFGRYMSPALVAALKRDPSLLALGGRTRTVTVLFSDVAGFTRLSESLSATQVVHLLNRYLTDHCAAVMDEGGVVDKFEGDAVMAFYGDPVDQPDHALRACRTALRVQRELPRLRPLLDELGLEDFAVRVGLNSGEAVVGNMGSAQRFDYTCMGDTVNLASRIEGAAKAFGVDVLVGDATAVAAGDAVLCKPLGEIVVVGRAQPVAVHELVAERAEADEALVAHVEAFARALAAARAGEHDDARAALDDADRLRPEDGPVAWFRTVLDGLGDAPWDGVTVLGSK